MTTTKIPWWINSLAKLHPFWFCADCAIAVKSGDKLQISTPWQMIKRWALDRCTGCGVRSNGRGAE